MKVSIGMLIFPCILIRGQTGLARIQAEYARERVGLAVVFEVYFDRGIRVETVRGEGLQGRVAQDVFFKESGTQALDQG